MNVNSLTDLHDAWEENMSWCETWFGLPYILWPSFVSCSKTWL